MARVTIKVDGHTLRAAGDLVKLVHDWVQESRQPGREAPVQLPPDPYSLLGLSPDATNDEIKLRYRRLSQLFHPDKQGGNVEAQKRLNEAYRRMCDDRGMAP